MNFPNARFSPNDAEPGTHGYVYHDPRIILAVNVALATRRPLFVTGVPGCGKSTLATAVAQALGWKYVRTTITSRTRLDDLVARFDAVRRLNDAQANQAGEIEKYIIPGVLWWAFDAGSARRMLNHHQEPEIDDSDPDRGTVALLDEIDKAEPDLPNDLLVPLDSYSITVPGYQEIRAAREVLVVITSNGERTMPPAFLRRCVALELDDCDPEFFTSVAAAHFGHREDTLYDDLARRTIELGSQAEDRRLRKPSMAEYLDAVRACVAFDQRPPTNEAEATSHWAAIEEAALRKTRRPFDGEVGR